MFELKETSFGLTSLLESIASGLADRAASKGIELISFTGPSVPDRIKADSRALRRTLTSLGRFTVDNAGSSEVVLYAEVDKKDPGFIRFFISGLRGDISPSDHPITFDKLVEAEIARGSMNLSAANQIASIIDGGIQLANTGSKGTVFTFAIKKVETAASGFTPPAGLKGVRILIVDDNPVNCQAMQMLLESLGCKVKTLTRGVDVMPTLVRGFLANAAYRLVLLDQQMPGLSGKDILAAIRQNDSAKETRVIMLAPHGQVDRSVYEFGKDCSAIIEKPIRRIQLRQTVEYALGLRLDLPGSKLPKTGETVEKPRDRKLRILLAEDDVFSQQIATLLLSRLGLSVDTVFNGAEAVNAVKEKNYDLVFMDMHMPVMGGLDATSAIRQLPGDKKNIPIFAMTASEPDDAEKRWEQVGMNGYLTKPLDMKRISQVISGCLEHDFRVKTGPLKAPPVDPQNTAVLDINAILPNFGNDLDRYRGFLDEFIHSLPKRHEGLKKAFDANDWETLQRDAHTIKGVASSLGAMQLAQVSAILERQAKSKQPDSITTILNIHDMIELLSQKAKDQVPA